MNKKKIIIIAILLIVILLFPMRYTLKDGGSIEYKSILYKVTKLHRLESIGIKKEGTIIEILNKKVYENTYLVYEDNNQGDSDDNTTKTREDLFLIDEERHIYADFTNPRMILDGKVIPVKEISKTNCTSSCIYNYSEPIKVYKDGGSKLYSYTIDNQTYYVVECHKINGNRDTIISTNEDIVNKC